MLDSGPNKRPSAEEICETVNFWLSKDFIEIFNQAEEKRLELIELKRLGPDFYEKSHPKAIHTSIPLSFYLSNSSSMNLSNTKQSWCSILLSCIYIVLNLIIMIMIFFFLEY